MPVTAAKMVPDFWGFLQEQSAKLNQESARVQSDGDMKILVDKWLHPKDGVLAKLEDAPFFVSARPSARQIFMDTMKNRVLQVDREWREIWRSLHEE